MSWEGIALGIFVIGLAFTIWGFLYPKKVQSWYIGLMKFL